MKLQYSLTIISSLLLCAGAAVGAEIECPASITETPSVISGNAAWLISAKTGERPLEHAGIYLGSPAEAGAQVPDSTRTTRFREKVTWKLVRAPQDEFWVGCSYTGTSAILLKRLESGVTQCIATYTLLPSGRRQQLETMDCR